MTLKEEKKIIADYLRWQTGEKVGDDEIVETRGGDTHNRIIVDFGNGKYLYKSVDRTITVYHIIDTSNLPDSFAAEPIDYEVDKEVISY